MDRRVFDDAIGEVPPSTVDVDAVISRGRRAARVRRLANPVVAAGVAVVALTGVVTYVMTGDGGAPAGSSVVSSSKAPPPSSGPGSPSEVPRPGDGPSSPSGFVAVPPPQCEADDLESPGEAITRLSAAATEAVREQRPDVELTANTQAQQPQGTQHGPLEFYQVNYLHPGEPLPICDPDGHLMAAATTHGPEGDGNILFSARAAVATDDGCQVRATELVHCEQATGPGGEIIVKRTYRYSGGTVTHQVEVDRPDGTSLMVQAENIGTSSAFGGAPTASRPPLTHDQLVAIGVDPALTLFPE